MRAAGAVVVDPPVVGEQRAVLIVQGRQCATGDVLQHHAEQGVGAGRATRQIHDGPVGDDRIHAHRAGGVGVGRRHAAERGTGTDGDDRGRARGHLLHGVQPGATGQRHVLAMEFGGDRTLDHQHVLAVVGVHGVMQCGLGLVAGRGHEGLVVVQRDQVEDERADVRLGRAQQGLAAAGAVLHVQPDHRGAGSGGNGVRQGLRGRGAVGEREADRRGGREGAAEFEEPASADAAQLQLVADGLRGAGVVRHAASQSSAGRRFGEWTVLAAAKTADLGAWNRSDGASMGKREGKGSASGAHTDVRSRHTPGIIGRAPSRGCESTSALWSSRPLDTHH
jgi:hypothetical protein